MLVLTRRQGEAIVIGNKLVRIVVTEIRGSQVRIGVEIHPEIGTVRIDREEVFNDRASADSRKPRI